jgi:hypothetical protein
MPLPILLYAFSRAKKSQRDRQQAASITTYGQVGGQGPVIGIKQGDPVPDDFMALTAVTGQGTAITLPKPEKKDPQEIYMDVFAKDADSLPGSAAFNDLKNGGARTMIDWQIYYQNMGVQPGAAMTENLGKLVRVGDMSSKTKKINLNEKLFKVEEEDSTTAPIQIGKTRPGRMINDKFFSDDKIDAALKFIKQLKEEGTPVNIIPGNQRTFTQTVGGKSSNFVDFEKGGDILQVFKDAIAVQEKTENTLVWTEDGAEKTWTPTAKTAEERSQGWTNWTAAKVADNFDWSKMGKPSLSVLYENLFENIRASLGQTTPNGLVMTDPKVMLKVAPGSFPNEFAVGLNFEKEDGAQADPEGRISFKRYFMSRVRGIEANQIKLGGKISGAVDPSYNVTFNERVDGKLVTVPGSVQDPAHADAFQTMVMFGINMGVPEGRARSRAANLLGRTRNPDDPSILTVNTNQPNLLAIANLAKKPSDGPAPNMLLNATFNYDPAIVGFEAIEDELTSVAVTMQGLDPSDDQRVDPDFNDKLKFVGAWAPDVSPKSGGQAVGLETFYSLANFSEDVFSGKSFQEMQESEATIARSSLEAARLVSQSMSLLFIVAEDGTVSMAPFGQSVGEKVLAVSSFFENLKAGGKMIIDQILPEDSAVGTALSTMLGQAEEVAKAIDAGDQRSGQMIAAHFGSYNSARTSITRPGQSKEAFAVAEEEARKKTNQDLREIIKGMTSTDTFTANVSKRKYLNYVIAYSVAAALQGGTGGRTISDQDVQNVLNFIAPGLSTPDLEYRTMNSLLQDLVYRAQRGAALSKKGDKQTVYNAMIVSSLESKEGFDVVKSIQNRVRFNLTDSGDIDGDGKDVKKPTDVEGITIGGTVIPTAFQDEFLAFVNKQRRLQDSDLDPLTIDELTKDGELYQATAAKFMSNPKRKPSN